MAEQRSIMKNKGVVRILLIFQDKPMFTVKTQQQLWGMLYLFRV